MDVLNLSNHTLRMNEGRKLYVVFIYQNFKICNCDDDFEGCEIKFIDFYFLLHSIKKNEE